MHFAQFLAAYPITRRKGGEYARSAFAQAVQKVPFAVLLHALEQHKRSVQWQNPRFIPSMITWLEQECWLQVLPEPEPDHARLTPYQQAKRLGLK